MAKACVSCGTLLAEPIDLTAGGKCPRCLDDPLLNSLTVGRSKAAVDGSTLQIVQAQKRAIFVFGLSILEIIAHAMLLDDPLVFLALAIAIGVLQLISVYKLAWSLRKSAGILTLITIIPFMGIFILLVLILSATKILNSRGVRVGLLGVSDSNMPSA